ncbi:hypothetical protein [Brazilian marseillevirus]|uniref:hypothetical protein n=1 Tax=Brazilian marseillevirus TaxID=1813599 RepID=UPI000783F4D4|nr:hypothetical protein A3303_gp087 [Brazilian marseillevirus]AMQ10595.1 hypothetical protein [Brazilian marseillevirus]
MCTLIPSLLDMCCFRIVVNDIDTRSLFGNEAAVLRIQEFFELEEGKRESIDIRNHQVGYYTLAFLMGYVTQEYIDKISRALLLTEQVSHSQITGDLAENLENSIPLTGVLAKLSEEVRELIISLYLFTDVEIDENRLEFLCKL